MIFLGHLNYKQGHKCYTKRIFKIQVLATLSAIEIIHSDELKEEFDYHFEKKIFSGLV